MANKRKKAAKAARLHKDKMARNKPKKTNHPTKSHVVKACANSKEKLLGLVNKVLRAGKILNQLKISVGSHIMRVIMHKIVNGM